MSGKSSDLPPDDGSAAEAGAIPPGAICPGALFAAYELEELIGVGSTASIYRARDARLLREVAIKIWTSGAPAEADGLAEFLHEARAAAAIRHPNVVSIFDVGVHDGAPFIVMELLVGEDLDARLRSVRALPESALIELALPLVAGLMAVHEAGVVHRDLKPSNVFLGRGPKGKVEPTLLDVGVSKHSPGGVRLTTLGRQRWAAMPLYTAPEVLLGGEATFRSDQYSLGVLLYECVTGVNPFLADSARDSIELITAGQYLPAWAHHAQRASRGLARVIERAMSPDPDERFADLRELGRALVSVAGRRTRGSWGSAFGSEVVPTAPQPKARPASARRRVGAWVVGAAVAGWGVAGALSAWFLTGTPRGVSPATVTPALSPASPPLAGPGLSAVVSSPGGSSVATPSPAPQEQPAPVAGEPVALAHHSVGAGETHDGLPLPPPHPQIGAGGEAELGAGVVPEEGPLDEGPLEQAPLEALPPGAGVPGPIPDGSPAAGSDGLTPSGAAAAPNPERGTNGALIFD